MTIRAYVVDENVPIVANGGKRVTAPPSCIAAAANWLRRRSNDERIVVDRGFAMIGRYVDRVGGTEQDPGSRWVRWLLANRKVTTKVVLVTLDVVTDPHGEPTYAAFPIDDALRGFDEDDRIWVAAVRAALALGRDARIVNAVDSDWHEHYGALQSCGIEVEELCPDSVRRSPGRRRGS